MVKNIFSLKNKVVLVTGATGHLGLEISKSILDSDAHVILTSKNLNKLKKVKNNFFKDNKKVDIYKMDVTNSSSIKNCINYVKKKHKVINGLINNAFSGKDGSIENIDEEDFLLATKYNLIAPFILIKNIIKTFQNFKKNNTLSVINIASMYGITIPNFSVYDENVLTNPVHYGATKAGLIHMTKYLASYLAKKNIRVNSISPGAFPKESILKKNKNFKRRLIKNIPIGRVGNPKEITGAIIYLLSDSSSYVTGANFSIDGGWTSK